MAAAKELTGFKLFLACACDWVREGLELPESGAIETVRQLCKALAGLKRDLDQARAELAAANKRADASDDECRMAKERIARLSEGAKLAKAEGQSPPVQVVQEQRAVSGDAGASASGQPGPRLWRLKSWLSLGTPSEAPGAKGMLNAAYEDFAEELAERNQRIAKLEARLAGEEECAPLTDVEIEGIAAKWPYHRAPVWLPFGRAIAEAQLGNATRMANSQVAATGDTVSASPGPCGPPR